VLALTALKDLIDDIVSLVCFGILRHNWSLSADTLLPDTAAHFMFIVHLFPFSLHKVVSNQPHTDTSYLCWTLHFDVIVGLTFNRFMFYISSINGKCFLVLRPIWRIKMSVITLPIFLLHYKYILVYYFNFVGYFVHWNTLTHLVISLLIVNCIVCGYFSPCSHLFQYEWLAFNLHSIA